MPDPTPSAAAPPPAAGLPPCLLRYDLPTAPQPLQASTADTPSPGQINVVVGTPEHPVWCDQIQIAVPVGPGAGDLADAIPAVAPSTARWTVGPALTSEGGGPDGYVTFTCTARSAADQRIDYDLAFSIYADAVNLVTGSFDLYVTERSGETDDPAKFMLRGNRYTLSKSAPQFYLRNLVPSSPAAGREGGPRAAFANGEPIRITWESNGTFFQLVAGQQVVYSGPDTAFELSAGLAQATTFVLVASVPGGPRSGTPEPDYETIYLYDTVTVNVADPDLTPKSVSAGGDVRAGSALAGSSLAVSGPAALNGGVDVAGDLHSTGRVAAGGAVTSGSGTSSFADVAVTGAARVGSMAVQTLLDGRGGAVKLFSGGTPVDTGTYVARTDGFVIGAVGWPRGSAPYVAYAKGASNGVEAFATGSNAGDPRPGTFLLPVSAGAQVQLWAWQKDVVTPTAPISFHWVPLGTGSLGSHLERTGDAPEVPHPAAPELPDREAARLEFVGLLEQLLGKPIGPEVKAKLLDTLRVL